MVNRGAFHGARKEFLVAEKPVYRAGVLGGYAGDALAGIQRRYFKRFPVDLPDDEDPSPEQLATVDDDAPDEEQPEPDEEAMSCEEYSKAVVALTARRKLVTFRKGQIKRWQAYQYMKDSDMDPKESGAHNPYRVLLHKLTNVGLTRPRLMNTANLWRKTHRAEVEAETERRIKVAGAAAPTRNQLATFRDKVARDLFNTLDQEAKNDWAEKAKEEHEAALVQWKKDIESRPSEDPAERQRCIQGLVKFVQPVLDIIGEATGWSATLIAGGPEPAAGGRLSIISVHSGATPGDVKMNFGRAERQRYKTLIVPIYSAFLRKCYSLEECRARALPLKDECEGLISLNLDADGANFDSASTSDQSTSSADPEGIEMSSSTAVDSVETSSTAVDPHELRDAQPVLTNPITEHTPAPPSAPTPSTAPPPPDFTAEPSQPSPPAHRSTPHSSISTHPNHRSPLLSPMPSRQPSLLPPSPHQPLPSQSTREPSSRVDQPAPSNQLAQLTESSTDKQPSDATGPLAEKRSRTESSPPPRQSRKRPAPQQPNPEHEQPRRKRLRSSVPIPARTRAQSSRNIPVKSSAKATTKTSNSRPRNPQPSPAVQLFSAPSRRRKGTASNLLPPPPIIEIAPVDEGAQSWFVPILQMFRSEDFGAQWSSLVSRWAIFEQRAHYQSPLRLSGKRRPPIIGEWIRRARAPTWRPIIEDIGAYEEGCRMWWTGLQPSWRVSDGVLLLDAAEGDWEVLRRPGINGIVSFVCALFFWGLYIKEEGDNEDMWNLMLLDGNRAFIGLLA